MDRVLILSLLAYFTFLGGLWALYEHGSPSYVKITIYDQLAKPGEKVAVAVKLEKDGPGLINPDVHDAEVELIVHIGVDRQATYKGITDDDGTARFDHVAPAEPGFYRIEARLTDTKTHTPRPGGPGFLHVLTPEKPILVCDIDDTVTAGEGWKLFFPGKEPDPLPGAAHELSALARRYQIVFLTARDDALLNVTRSWLTFHRFPQAAVMGRDWDVLSPFTTGTNKRTALEDWKDRFGPIAWGIGNSKGDRFAYGKVKAPHIIIGSDEPDRPDAEPPFYSARDWTAVAEIFRRADDVKDAPKKDDETKRNGVNDDPADAAG